MNAVDVTRVDPRLFEAVERLADAGGVRVALTLAVKAEPHRQATLEWTVWMDNRRVAQATTPEGALAEAEHRLAAGASPLRHLQHAPVVLNIIREVRGLFRDLLGEAPPR